ncbi:hypothetical protein LA5095_06363 [Roseibium album]|nr:hypothetical protein LA5095_06363 [Roseibium album]
MIDTFEGDHPVIGIGPQRIGHRLELVGQLALPHPPDFQGRARRVHQNILDMDMTEITAPKLLVALRIGPLMAPAVVGRVPQNLQRILCVQVVDQLAARVV